MEQSCGENSGCCAQEHELHTISLDFGQLPVDVTAVKAVKIRNDNCNEEYYTVQRDSTTNPMDIAFHFDKYSWSLDSKSSTVCQIQYRPILPFRTSIDYFTVVNCDKAILRIIVLGQSIGPNAVISADGLVMVCGPGGSVRKRLNIVNDSAVPANYIFDSDEIQNSFKPNPQNGVIGPNSHTTIVITFKPAFDGFHVCRLPCLIQHQAPITILLYGYCGKCEERANIPTLLDSPSFLSENYLDFGRTVPGSYNSINRSPLTTSFMNSYEMDMLVKWHEDVDGIFSLEPRKARVCARESCLFEVRFDPEEHNQFYTRDITADVFWISRNDSKPISSYTMIASIRLMGHTFSPGSSSWVPQYKIPRAVVMPPCLTSSSVYTNFVIRKFGHLPLMFRFIPPKESHFDVKPLMGVINKNYQVIGVEMFPEGDTKLLYERWSIIFNGNSEYEVFLDIRGFAENPHVSFSNEVVNFSPTHPGCERVQRVTMRNPTRHRLSYWFQNDEPSVLKIGRVRGRINPNEIVVHDWIFCPLEDGHYEFDVTCFTSAESHQKTCEINNSRLHVVGKSESGYLLATPDELNSGEQICREQKILSFQLINPGSVEIAYKLGFEHYNWPYEIKFIENVEINPSSGILCPEEEQKIEIRLTSHESGFHQLVICYSVRGNSQTDEIIPGTSSEICRINYFCVLPFLKVEDLLHHQTVLGMSKRVLWRLLNIKKLNKILNGLECGDRADLETNLPPMIVQNEKSIIKLSILNPTSAKATWSFKQIKLCSCSKKIEKRGLSSHFPKYNCLHRSLCTIYPKSGILEGYGKTTITVELHYAVLGETKLRWDLNVGYDRRICLCMKIIGLSGLEETAILPFGSNVQLKKIYIGDRDPINQVYWIYNPTLNDITYSVDVAPFKRINDNHRCEIFSCSNPSGTVKALSHQPILINYRPQRWALLEVKIPLTLGSENTAITIKADTSIDPLIRMSQETSPSRDVLCLAEMPVHFNTDCLILPPTPTHSRLTRLIIVHNLSETEVIACNWKRYKIPGIIELHVEPETTRIQPGTLQTHRLIVITGRKPSRINADITCEFNNQSQRCNYEKSVLVHDSICEESKHHFTITERGTTVPDVEKNKVEGPKPFYKSLTVRCHAYSLQDEDLKTRRRDRLKNTPPLEILLITRLKKLCVTRKITNLSKFILEGMIWEILQSTSFCEAPEANIEYSQITMKPLQRKKIQDRSYAKPSGRTIERILENMIFVIVHKEFGLDMIHLTQTSDARQVTYRKMWQQVHVASKEAGTEHRFLTTSHN